MVENCERDSFEAAMREATGAMTEAERKVLPFVLGFMGDAYTVDEAARAIKMPVTVARRARRTGLEKLRVAMGRVRPGG
jgi:hypothetical protein